IICEGKEETLNCTGCHLIHVLSATYGRHEDGNVYCNHESISDTNCGERDNALKVTAQHLNNTYTCSLHADHTLFALDPCRGTYKYLEIDFECIQGVDPCQMLNCQNGGTCVLRPLCNSCNASCMCRSCFTGDLCEDLGIAKIVSTNGIQWVNNSLKLVDDTKVEFDLQVKMKGDVLLVAVFTNQTIETNTAVNNPVVTGGV
ncbi:L-rhamnose-binding lectin CSL3-like, partial [Anneissia japonica]|uniref:L-rhamnose-binding lectin CSL3-like n=1 Tax=Anneissia japonica TaxID=1529436 RepID=UPI001425BB88